MEAGFNSQKYLELQGWQIGNGLGKNGNGITEPVRVEIKQDKRGVGCEPGGVSNYHWWEQAFNQAAANIQVTNEQSSVTVEQTTQLGNLSSTRGFEKKDAEKSLLYGRFTKLSTLTPAAGELWEKEEDSNSDVDTTSKLTDEELFRICGGRTAHKGARHGIRANGKLQRIAEQERLAALQLAQASSSTATRTEKMRKKRKDKLIEQSENEDRACEEDVVMNDEVTRELGTEESLVLEGVKLKKNKKSKRKDKEIVNEVVSANVNTNEEIECSNRKSKKQKMKKDTLNEGGKSKKKPKKRT